MLQHVWSRKAPASTWLLLLHGRSCGTGAARSNNARERWVWKSLRLSAFPRFSSTRRMECVCSFPEPSNLYLSTGSDRPKTPATL
ncbi:hypothetical protein EB796_017652 [Bugula neritina]|uniref:Secreted protein n=1 Tax=Bugula neritina TaxID=10212 RepID=A0A7J7JEK9_BUGNE|nr:hypothetical protein EB796_017652 [Bugula neritina]